jgi:DNA polymerase elongation subunit (family B)
MNKRIIVLDLETQKGFHEVDRSKLHQLKVSVVGIYDSFDEQYLCFEEKDFLRLEERLKLADLIVGFNINGFDFKVLGPYLLTDVKKFKVLDLLDEIHKILGHRVSLQSLAEGTFKDSKSGTGWDAIQLFRDGRMEELKKYCLDDVRLTKKVYEYGLEHKKVYYFSNRDFRVHEINVDWSQSIEAQHETESSFPTSLF